MALTSKWRRIFVALLGCLWHFCHFRNPNLNLNYSKFGSLVTQKYEKTKEFGINSEKTVFYLDLYQELKPEGFKAKIVYWGQNKSGQKWPKSMKIPKDLK